MTMNKLPQFITLRMPLIQQGLVDTIGATRTYGKSDSLKNIEKLTCDFELLDIYFLQNRDTLMIFHYFHINNNKISLQDLILIS